MSHVAVTEDVSDGGMAIFDADNDSDTVWCSEEVDMIWRVTDETVGVRMLPDGKTCQIGSGIVNIHGGRYVPTYIFR